MYILANGSVSNVLLQQFMISSIKGRPVFNHVKYVQVSSLAVSKVNYQAKAKPARAATEAQKAKQSLQRCSPGIRRTSFISTAYICKR